MKARTYIIHFIVVFILLAKHSFGQVKPTEITLPGAATPIAPPAAYPATRTGSFVRIFKPRKPYTDAAQVNRQSGKDNVLEVTSFHDALGREIQSVARQYSPEGLDGITAHNYDAFGRESHLFMGYTASASDGELRNDPFTESVIFNTTIFPNEKIFYGRNYFDNSPLNVVEKKTAPGNSWEGAGIGIAVVERAVRATEGVRRWTIASTPSAVPLTTTAYGTGELAVREKTDEQGRITLEYADEQGRVILTKTKLDPAALDGHIGWLCTYTIYDELNNVKAIIPPAATEAVRTDWNLSRANIFTELCAYMDYDEYSRLIYKKLPGIDPIEVVYDKRDRTAFVREGLHKQGNYWMAKFYDAADRVTMTAIYNSTATRADLQAQVNALPPGSQLTIPATSLTPLSYNYYDDYSFTDAAAFQASHQAKNLAGENLHAETTVSRQQATVHLPTGSKVRVIGTDTWLTTTQYYDSRNRLLQQAGTNIAGGLDYETFLYNFSGDMISRYQHHKNPKATQTPELKILTLQSYDHGSRLMKVRKQLNETGTLKTISQWQYRKNGSLQKKTLGDNLESLEYDYNIRGWLAGVNKNYARTGAGHFFGFELSYDYGFSRQELSGNPAGVTWRGYGDGKWRAYGYTYDLANRLIRADFTQKNSAWNITEGVDYTVSNVTYDANGNLKSMNSNGLLSTTSGAVDNLTYTYANGGLSNKLLAVADQAGFQNKQDFNNANTALDDYAYDVNGNLTQDKNKSISAIIYNHLNKAESVNLGTKGSIRYYFDATGNKVQMISKETGKADRVTDYIDTYVYENNQLKVIPQEEGRIRPVYVTGSPVTYVYDYFILDQQDNVRMILTEQSNWQLYAATMETENVAVENALFSNLDETRAAKPSGYPEAAASEGNKSVARLNSKYKDRKIGPSLVLRVTAGDTVTVGVRAFYKSMEATAKGKNAPTADMLGALVQAFGGSGAEASGKAGGGFTGNHPFTEDFTTRQYQRLKEKEPGQQNAAKPRAYLNFVLFDDQFKLVEECSGVKQVNTPDVLETLGTQNLEIAKTGFLYVYVSNETEQDVYFDNLTVLQMTGPVMEENHFYPFGMSMAGISSNAPDKAKNRYKYNGGSELTDDMGLQIYETPYRWYDPQIGRFHSMDPLTLETIDESPFAFAGNNPVSYNDPWGDIKVGKSEPTLAEILTRLLTMPSGSSWKDGQYFYATSIANELGGTLSGKVNQDANNYYFWVGGFFKEYGLSVQRDMGSGMVNGMYTRLTIAKQVIEYTRASIVKMKAELEAARQKERMWEAVHTTLDVLGNIPLGGKFADLANASLYAVRGQTANALISLAGAAGLYGASLLKGAAKAGRVIKLQKHHIIPRAVAKKMNLKSVGWNNEVKHNLKKLPVPFHGWHPKYNDFVFKEIQGLKDMGNLDVPHLNQLIDQMRQRIADAYQAHKAGLGNLNDYFR